MSGRYPVRRTIFQIRSCTSGLAGDLPLLLMTRDTVETETPASAAISFKVIGTGSFLRIFYVIYFTQFQTKNPEKYTHKIEKRLTMPWEYC